MGAAASMPAQVLDKEQRNWVFEASGLDPWEESETPPSDDGLFSHEKWLAIRAALDMSQDMTVASATAWFADNLGFSDEKIAEMMGKIQEAYNAKAPNCWNEPDRYAALGAIWTDDFREKWKAAWLAHATKYEVNFYEFSPEKWAEAAAGQVRIIMHTHDREFSANDFGANYMLNLGGIDPAIIKIAEVPFLIPKVMTQEEFDGAVGVVKAWGAEDEVALNFMRALFQILERVTIDSRAECCTWVDDGSSRWLPELPFTPLFGALDAIWGDENGYDNVPSIKVKSAYIPHEEDSDCGEDF